MPMNAKKVLVVEDDEIDVRFDIEGLKFQPNIVYLNHEKSDDICRTKIASSPGPLISDFVTHQENFKYLTAGIHVGQDDRLTFMGGNKQIIIGHLIDCRKDSKTFGLRLHLEFRPSLRRRLIVPRGVAHSFENIQHVVTRDEPIWYTAFYNPDWDISNDLISIPLDIHPSELPSIEVNTYKLPCEGHVLFSRLQQENLSEAKRYATRKRANDGNYEITEVSDWIDTKVEYQELIRKIPETNGVIWEKNSFALTGRKSYTIVPSTSACVTDILEFDCDRNAKIFRLHRRQNTLLTFLDREGTSISVDLFDVRANRKNKIETLTVSCDPRVRLRLPAGVA